MKKILFRKVASATLPLLLIIAGWLLIGCRPPAATIVGVGQMHNGVASYACLTNYSEHTHSLISNYPFKSEYFLIIQPNDMSQDLQDIPIDKATYDAAAVGYWFREGKVERPHG